MLKAEDLGFRLKDKQLIQNINLSFRPGVLYGIVGPNGSGKSTLLKSLSAIWTPTSGRVLWNGEELHKRPRREISRTISLVPQTPHIPFDFTVEEFVAMGRYPQNHPLQNDNVNIINALKSMDVWNLRNQLINQISSGERQRAYIARSLVTESAILLLDEPTASLDIKHQLEIWQLLRQLKNDNRVMVVTIHDLASAERFCDEIVVLHQGRSVAAGEFNTIMDAELLGRVFGIARDDKQSFSLVTR